MFIHFLWADVSSALVEMAQMWLSQRNWRQRREAEPSYFKRVKWKWWHELDKPQFQLAGCDEGRVNSRETYCSCSLPAGLLSKPCFFINCSKSLIIAMWHESYTDKVHHSPTKWPEAINIDCYHNVGCYQIGEWLTFSFSFCVTGFGWRSCYNQLVTEIYKIQLAYWVQLTSKASLTVVAEGLGISEH